MFTTTAVNYLIDDKKTAVGRDKLLGDDTDFTPMRKQQRYDKVVDVINT